MTTTTSPPPTGPTSSFTGSSAASGTPPAAGGGLSRGSQTAESAAAKRARLALRRRLITWSIPVVVLALVVAVKLLVMGAAGQRALDGFYANSADAVHQAADTMSFVNVVERHKAPFARGDAWVLAGDLDRARAAFEEALALAPGDSPESCQIRVNLALTLEKLGDAAKNAGDEAAARRFWQQVVELTAATPPGCFDPPAEGAGDKSKNAGARAKAKLDPNGQPPPQSPDEQRQQEEQRKQDDLDKKSEDNQRKRAEEGPDGQQQRPPGSGRTPPGAKPW
jgi:tetratricopeptide (TPR) repeat protein